ncbi:MAG: hypothetical protein GX594_01570 [Pirellulaceae bacterium]|nr:hypothetical protein [Pirellulaceae bacterium]
MKQTTKKARNKRKKTTAANAWASLTWDDLNWWAGGRSVQRGRNYQRQGRVKDLAIAGDGRLLATVQGREIYLASVWLNDGRKVREKLESHCMCPVGYRCKHAVATVAEYLQMLADGTPVSQADKDDPRWDKLSGADKEYEDDLDEWDVEDDELDDWEDDEGDEDENEAGDCAPHESKLSKPASARSARRTRDQWNEKIEQHIRAKTHVELVEHVLSLVDRFPELREEYCERVALGEGDVKRLVAQAKREMRERSSEIGWQNHWKGEGHTPDYDRLKHRLERLVELDHANAVVELGREFIQLAINQVEVSHDEGETAMAAAECLPVIFDAVLKSTFTTPQKILFAIDACLMDGYSMLEDSVEKILDAKWEPADWSAVADELRRRLAKTGNNDDDPWSRDYHRNRLSKWLSDALENAGRDDEVLPVYEAEARTTHSYERLVRYLISKKRYEDAKRWAEEGIEKTREKWPGIASSLAGRLCEMARSRKQWAIVAAHAAYEFFDRPSKQSFDALVSAAVKAKCGDQVRAAALQFLEQGRLPFKWIKSPKKGQSLRVDPGWPLPFPEYLLPFMQPRERSLVPKGPLYNVLLDMAIAAKRPDDVLRWFDKMPKAQQRFGMGRGWIGEETADRVANAVAKSHPERALEIYQHGLKQVLPHADFSAYESAGNYLNNMRPIMKSLGRDSEWQKTVANIRETYRNRPRFMEVLDRLEGRTILQTQKARRR